MGHWWKVLGIVPLVGGIYYACDTPETKKGPSLEEKVEGKKYSLPEENQRTSRHQQKETPKYHPPEEARTEITKYLKQKRTEPLQKVQSPKSSVPDYTLPEDDIQEEEYPTYYIPPEERDYQNATEFRLNFFEALEAQDYKAAESYIADIPKYFAPSLEARMKQSYLCHITVDYNRYLSAAIQNCKEQDAFSVLRKVIWMESFLGIYYNDIITCGSPDVSSHDYISKKGEKALQEVINCTEEP